MDQKRKRLALMKLWNSFPSALSTDDEKAAVALDEWLEIVEPFSSEAIEAGCKALKRRDCAFLPSTGQIYHECERASADLATKRRSELKAIPSFKSDGQPKSFLEKWEREKGHLHPRREQLIDLRASSKTAE